VFPPVAVSLDSTFSPNAHSDARHDVPDVALMDSTPGRAAACCEPHRGPGEDGVVGPRAAASTGTAIRASRTPFADRAASSLLTRSAPNPRSRQRLSPEPASPLHARAADREWLADLGNREAIARLGDDAPSPRRLVTGCICSGRDWATCCTATDPDDDTPRHPEPIVLRDSARSWTSPHLIHESAAQPGTTRRSGKPCSTGSVSPFIS
jgi:hypothetical protein